MGTNNIFSGILYCVLSAVAFLFMAPQSMALTTVDCDSNPNALQDELDVDSDFEYEINGTCTDDDGQIEIFAFNGFTRFIDNTTGSTATDAVIDADILVSGAAEAVFNDIEIRGDDAKNVIIADNARGEFNNVIFGDNVNAPSLFATDKSHVEIDSCTFNPITSRTNGEPIITAVSILNNSFARISNSTIDGQETNFQDFGAPVQAIRDSSILLRGGNVITNNSVSGSVPAVGAFDDSSIRQDDGSGNGIDTINGGLTISGNSHATVRAANINGDADNNAVEVDQSSVFRSQATGAFGSNGVTIDGMTSDPVLAREASVVDLDDDTVVNGGTVTCEDTTQLLNDGFGGTHSIDCSVFHVETGAGGNVGIGTRSPSAKLHVDGNARFDGTFSIASSRDVKEEFSQVQPREVLEELLELSVAEWSYRDEERSARHMGPVAEDFSAAFGLGADDKHISPTDLSGVAFAAIQGLHQVVRDREAEIRALERQSRENMREAREQIDALRRSRDDLANRVARLEALMREQGSDK